MASGFVIRRNQYFDSVFLMGVSKRISGAKGVQRNAVLMGSEANKKLLGDIGIADARIAAAQPNDLIVAVIADTAETVERVLGELDAYLQGGGGKPQEARLRSFEEGLAQKPQANLAVISVPGEYAAREARRALEAGLNVFLFSDNVAIDDELDLKRLAAEKHLLVMGPDCGTSLIGGVGIGFANVVRRGSIGAIGPSGTGLQEFTSLVHQAGCGISHAIGTGSHDLSDRIGGLTTLAALDALEADPQTEMVALIAKPPGENTLARLGERLQGCRKPVVGCFLGIEQKVDGGPSFRQARVIDEAVALAVAQVTGQPRAAPEGLSADEAALVRREAAARDRQQRYVRGLFAGGTFCYQSQQIFRDVGLAVHSNAPLGRRCRLADPDRSVEHTFVDMGDDRYTVGRPHPMIDGMARRERILAEGRDPEVAVLLLDFVLGYNASPDPVGELLGAIVEAKEMARDRGGALTVVASVCGTDGDPQGLSRQRFTLQESGVIVFRSNAQAARFCAELVRPGGRHAQPSG